MDDQPETEKVKLAISLPEHMLIMDRGTGSLSSSPCKPPAAMTEPGTESSGGDLVPAARSDDNAKIAVVGTGKSRVKRRKQRKQEEQRKKKLEEQTLLPPRRHRHPSTKCSIPPSPPSISVVQPSEGPQVVSKEQEDEGWEAEVDRESP